jgi:hypothetical protein
VLAIQPKLDRLQAHSTRIFADRITCA